jgi:hypothetical protein
VQDVTVVLATTGVTKCEGTGGFFSCRRVLEGDNT